MAEEGEADLAVLELRHVEGGGDDARLVAGDEARAALRLDLGMGRSTAVPMAVAAIASVTARSIMAAPRRKRRPTAPSTTT